MECLTLKRIFKTTVLSLWCCVFGLTVFIFPHTYVVAQEEDEEDIEWFDEEDEIEASLQPEDETDNTESVQSKDKETEKADGSAPGMETVTEDSAPSDTDTAAEDSDTETTTEDSVTDTEAVSEDIPADTPMVDAYEQSLYETYIQYYSRRVSAEEWVSVAGDKDTYVVREKDTLWDISKILFGDSSYWPKLWSANPAITNPHLILPNNSLGFVYGTEGTPPSLSIITGDPTQKGKNPSPALPVPEFLKNKKVVVPISKGIRPVMRSLPSSLPPLYLSNRQETSMSDMTLGFGKAGAPKVGFLNYYMSDEPLSGQGIIFDKRDYGSWFHMGQRVILEMQDSVNPGQRLTVIENRGKLYSDEFGVRGPFGYQVEVQGEVEVVGRLPDSFDLYEAKVTKSLNHVTVGSIVLSSHLIQFDYKPTDISGNSEAQIIGVPSSGTHKKKVASPYSLVYLNRGSGSGLSVGQMYQVKANPSIKRQMKHGYDIKVGEVKIVYTEDRFATGVITKMSNPVRVGDYITSLGMGLSTRMGYDPLDDDVEGVAVEKAAEPVDDDDLLEEASDSPEFSDDEDVFEAFE